MITTFRNKGTEDVFDGIDSRAARSICPPKLWSVAQRKLDQINQVNGVNHLQIPPGNRLERLRGTREGQFSIRINDKYRICFGWRDGEAYDVEITDYH